MKGAFTYANGYNISQSRRLARFYFGDFLYRVVKNDEKRRFDIYLEDKVITGKKANRKVLLLDEELNVNYFRDYWNSDNIEMLTTANKKEGYFNIIILKQDF